jgi:hypothetical protein
MGWKLTDLDPKLRSKILELDQQQNSRRVGAVEAGVPKPAATQALDSPRPQRKAGKGSVEAVVTITVCTRKLYDSDGYVSACKPLRDAIAKSLGIDDGDPRIRFEYASTASRGTEGCVVKIEYL